MALIKCPECGKEISDTVKACPNCGYKKKKLDKKKKKKIIIISAVVIVLLSVATILGIFITKNNQEKLDKEYHDQLVETGAKIYANGLVSNLVCHSIGQIWYMAIFDKFTFGSEYYKYKSTDFNKAISLYLEDNKNNIENLKNQRNEINDEILKLQKKPNEKYKDAYDKMIELYGAFNSLADQAISPSGTYKDYVSKYNLYSEDLTAAYKQLIVLIPEIKDYKAEDN